MEITKCGRNERQWSKTKKERKLCEIPISNILLSNITELAFINLSLHLLTSVYIYNPKRVCTVELNRVCM